MTITVVHTAYICNLQLRTGLGPATVLACSFCCVCLVTLLVIVLFSFTFGHMRSIHNIIYTVGCI